MLINSCFLYCIAITFFILEKNPDYAKKEAYWISWLLTIFEIGYLAVGWQVNWMFTFKNWTIAREMPKILNKVGMVNEE